MYKYLIIILMIFVSACSDLNFTHYNTYWAAKDSKVFDKGWLPDILPTSTIKIRVKNDFKEGSFKIPEADLANFTNQIESTTTFGGNEVYYYWGPDNKVIWYFYISSNGYVIYDLIQMGFINNAVNKSLNEDATSVAPVN